MTRDEYLAQLREEFIDRHLAPPGWMEHLPTWLQEYVLPLYWIFFKPSALRLHINRLAPDFVDERGQVGLRSLRMPAVRALVIRALSLTLLLSLSTVVPLGLTVSVLGLPLDWEGALVGIALGIALGMAYVALDVIWGVALDADTGVAASVASGVALGAAAGVTTSIALGVVTGVSGSIITAMRNLIWVAAQVRAQGVVNSVIWFLATIGVTFTAILMSTIVLGSVTLVLLLSISLLNKVLATWSPVREVETAVPCFPLPRSSLALDELLTLPNHQELTRRLTVMMDQDLEDGAWGLAYIACRDRRALTRAMSPLLTAQPVLLPRLFYHLLHNPLPYIAPTENPNTSELHREADPYFSPKIVLATLAGYAIPLSNTLDLFPPPLNPLNRLLTAFSNAFSLFLVSLYQSLPAPQAHLCLAYYQLLETAAPTDPRDFDPAALPRAAEKTAAAFGEFLEYPVGAASYHTYHTFARFLRIEALGDLTEAPRALEWLPPTESAESRQSAVLTTLRRLGDVGRAIIAYQSASSELARRDRLTEAQAVLDEVRERAKYSPDIPEPCATLMGLIVDRWYKVVAAERDAVATEREFAPLDDFYVAGPPLTPESGRLFVGRQDIFRRVEELWRNPHQKASIVLHGQRRIGKTSILYHLEQNLGPGYLTVVADLQGILSNPAHPIQNDADLWQALARAVARRLRKESTDIRPRSGEGFEDFLERSNSLIGDRTLVLMLDEFEKLEQKINDGAVSRDFLEHLRHLIQHQPNFLVLLAGHHTLRQRMRRYWGPLMGVARPLRVSYLDEVFARDLITDPWDGFRLNYRQSEIQRLMKVTGCQPMLLQFACSNVIKQVNQRMKRDGYKNYPTARPEEVERALDGLLEADETYYFDAIWDWLTEEQQAALKKLTRAYGDDQHSWEDSQEWIECQAVPDLDAGTLQALVDREVLRCDETRCRFRVELLRRWVHHLGYP